MRRIMIMLTMAAVTVACCFSAAGPAASAATRSASATAGFVMLGGAAGVPAVNPRTATLYVPVQCTTSFCSPNKPGHVVDIISTARCHAQVSSGCTVLARARVGSAPLAAVVDARTDTVYVLNGTSNTVSVLNGARCNARVTSGCARPAATVKVGKMPVAAVVNPATRTLYVANLAGGSVSVINAATCNAVTTRGCGQPARTVADKAGPDWIDVNPATDTVYTANSGTANPAAGDTVSVIDGATCNGTNGSGCGVVPPTVKVGSGPFALAVDQATDTVYVANNNDGTVSVIDGARCNARVTSGCARPPLAVTTGAGPSFVAVDHGLHTAFVMNADDNTLSAINTRTCNGTVISSCRTVPPSRLASPNQNPGYNPFPNAFALVPQTGTAYVVNIGGATILTVASLSGCNAVSPAGCRRLAPAVPTHVGLMAANPATGTLYTASFNLPQIDVFSMAACRAGDLGGCVPVATIPMGHPMASVGAIDDATHTLYAADAGGTMAVINTATCNAHVTTGCAAKPPSIKIGTFPNVPAINPVTRTLYVTFGTAANKVAVVNTATCNATDTSGCRQTPAVFKVAAGTVFAAVSTATDTVYSAGGGFGASVGTVSVINGATCNGTNHSGCGHIAATAKAGAGPFGVTVNDRTHTVYVVNNADGDAPGSVSVINGATCNGTHTAGCHQHFPTFATGRSPLILAVDERTDALYVSDFSSAGVTVMDGSRCNASVTSGCGAPLREQPVGSQPFPLAVNPRNGTVYVGSTFQAASMSVFAARR
jgi:DNA-binding beta-propeller fold protein YncE